MKFFGFVVVFLAIGLELTESKPSEDKSSTTTEGRAPSTTINWGCQCSNRIYVDEAGKTHGNCRSADASGALWCFAAAESTCQDIQTTAKGPYEKAWSYEACATPAPPKLKDYKEQCVIDCGDNDVGTPFTRLWPKNGSTEFALDPNGPELCLEGCLNIGYLFAGVQFAHECWCGNTAPTKERFVAASECDYACKGNPTEICGGFCRMNVYYK